MTGGSANRTIAATRSDIREVLLSISFNKPATSAEAAILTPVIFDHRPYPVGVCL
jgi:hypothetical protein